MPESRSSNGKRNGRADQQASQAQGSASGPRNTNSATGTNSTATRPMVHLDEFLAQISERLTAAGSIQLSRTQPKSVSPVDRMQAVVFTLAGVHYAVDIAHVSEVGRRSDITRVPGVANWVLGVINLHGEIVSVVDLARFLELNAATQRSVEVMIVMHAGDQKIGLMVDEIEPIFTFPTEQIISPPFKIEPSLVHYLRGAIDREGEFVRLLDCERLLLGPQMQRFS